MAVEPKLYPIPPQQLGEVFPLIKDLIERVVERSNGAWTVPSILEDIAAKRWYLWVIHDVEVRGIVAAELHVAKSGMRICSIHFCTGHGAKDWTHLLGQIEAWARANDCARIDTLARKGWARHLPDYKVSHVLLEKDLR